MKEAGSDEEDSDLSEESKNAVKPRKAKQNMAAANRDMPPSSSSDEEEGTEAIVEQVNEDEEEKKGEEDDSSEDDDDELERLYGLGKNNNKDVKVCA